MLIRTATLNDLTALAQVEAACFPPEEAASVEKIAARLAVYPDYFWLCYEYDQLVGFADGMVTDCADLEDVMYDDAQMHNPQGQWQMIFGLNTVPEYRRRGYAAALVRKIIATAKEEGRMGVVLTCKENLLPYYEKFGFVSEGISHSTHGNVIWYQMRLRFKD